MSVEVKIAVITIFGTFISTLAGAFLGGLFAYKTTKKSVNLDSVRAMYENLFVPINDLIERDGKDYESFSFDEKKEYLEYIKAQIITVINQAKDSSSKKLLEYTDKLEVSTYNDYCTYISDNINACIHQLGLVSPYPFYGKGKKFAIKMCFISMVIAIASLIAFTIINFVCHIEKLSVPLYFVVIISTILYIYLYVKIFKK